METKRSSVERVPAHAGEPAATDAGAPSGFEALAAEFAKPQFMTTTSGPGSVFGTRKYSLEFSFIDEGDSTEGHERWIALHQAIRAAAVAVNP